ncbi:MAG: hypothetical protein RLY97_1649 [Pseudomonadota bacterium]
MTNNPEAQLAGFLAAYSPEVAEKATAILARMRVLLPHADALVYDNYNALAVAFSPNGKTGAAICSIAVYPRWVSLFVSAKLDDPTGIMRGQGGRLRHVVLDDAVMLDRADVAAFIAASIARAQPPFDPAHMGQLVIKSVSAKQRPRR